MASNYWAESRIETKPLAGFRVKTSKLSIRHYTFKQTHAKSGEKIAHIINTIRQQFHLLTIAALRSYRPKNTPVSDHKGVSCPAYQSGG